MTDLEEGAGVKSITDQLNETLQQLTESQKEDVLNFTKNWVGDRRSSKRSPYFMTIDYSDDNRLEYGIIQSISAGGIFIQPPSPLLPTGRPLTMSFEHPNKPKHLELNGRIVWKDQRGMGIQFDQEIEDLTEE